MTGRDLTDGRLTKINDLAVRLVQESRMQLDKPPATSPNSGIFDGAGTSLASLDIAEATHLRLLALARYVGAKAGDSGLIDNRRSQIIVVVQGAVKLIASASGGRKQVMAFYFKGDLIYVPARESHAYNLSALNECQIISFPAAEFIRLAQSDRALNSKFMAQIIQALTRCREKSIGLGRKTARERVAAFLAGMADRIGMPFTNGCVLDLPMSRQDIGDNTGLTIETVSRQMTELRNAGLVTTSGRSQVRISDLTSLREQAGYLPVPASADF